MKIAFLFLSMICYSSPAQGAVPKKPKLVVAIVVDQFRYDYLTRFRKDYVAGFARLLERGAVFTDAHHVATPTVTAVGHSTFLTGAPPFLSGIAGNEWYDRETGKTVTSVFDDVTKEVGGLSGKPGSSPRRLLVSTLGDEIKMQGGDSKVIGISIKDRSAILPAGHMADGAYWYDSASNNWVTSTYYAAELPPWVSDINKSHPSQKYAASSWLPFDARNGQGKPFCTMVKGSEVPLCRGLEATPWGNEMIEEFAERAVVEERLGKHIGPDLLAVSFSANDYVGHAFGPDDPAVRDISIRTDRLLGKFFDFLNRQVPASDILIVLTADHGVSPIPETNRARKMPGGRLDNAGLIRLVQDGLEKKYGPGKWVLSTVNSSIYLNSELIRSKNLDQGEVERTAAAAALAQPHIYRVYSAEAIERGNVSNDSITESVRNGMMRKRSGDVIVVPEPYYISGVAGTTHGTPFSYDTHVPIIFLGAGIKPGSYWQRVHVTDIAPTLATILGVETPSGSTGRVLGEIFQ